METAAKCCTECLYEQLILATFHWMYMEGIEQDLLSYLFSKLVIEYSDPLPMTKSISLQ